MAANANSHAQQHFHNHNASIGRIPAGAVPTRGHTRELSNDNNMNNGREQGNAYPSIQSALQASAAPFGPGLTTAAPMTSAATVSSPTSTSMSQFHGFYPANGFAPLNANAGGNFGVPMLAASMQQMAINGSVNGGSMYPTQNYTGYGSVPFNQGGQPRDSQARVMQHRRQLDSEGI